MAEVVPLISVVIPTLGRPQVVQRAVRSALAQTVTDIEVIVIVDGPDEATVQVLGAIGDPRVRVRPLSYNLGSAAARNEGVDAARGRWIAFLDDDDEWFPHKLDIQLHAARQSDVHHPIVYCRFIKRSDRADVVLPRRLPKPGESMSEFLFRRTGLFGGAELLQTSTIFTTKELMGKVPFRREARRHDDLDWLLRASRRHDTIVQCVETSEPLAVWHREKALATISSRKDWRFSFSWIQQNRHLVSSQAYASFLLTWVSANAIEQGDRSAFWPLLAESYRQGRPSVLDGIVFIGIWLVPQRLRRWIASLATRVRC